MKIYVTPPTMPLHLQRSELWTHYSRFKHGIVMIVLTMAALFGVFRNRDLIFIICSPLLLMGRVNGTSFSSANKSIKFNWSLESPRDDHA